MGFKDKGYIYLEPMHKSVNMQFYAESWVKSNKLYEKCEYKKSFQEMLRYTNRKIKKYETSKFVYNIPHGSIFVKIDFSGDIIKISSDFLSIKNANKIPLFRRIAELNFSLNLSQITLDGDSLRFHYETPVELFHPAKIFDVLAEICYFADKYDEEFCENFGATPLSEAKIKEIDLSKKQKIYENFKKIIDSNFEIIEDLESRRKNHNAWDVISTTYKMIDFLCAPKGILQLRISEKVSELYSRETSLENIIFRGKEFLSELKNMSFEDFSKNIYESLEFIPNKKVATNEQISEYLKPGYNDAYQMLQSGDSEGAYIVFMHILYNSLYYHIVPYGMEKAIKKILKPHSNINLKKSTVSNLSNRIYELLNLQDIPSNHSGWFAIFWGIIMFILGLLFNQ